MIIKGGNFYYQNNFDLKQFDNKSVKVFKRGRCDFSNVMGTPLQRGNSWTWGLQS